MTAKRNGIIVREVPVHFHPHRHVSRSPTVPAPASPLIYAYARLGRGDLGFCRFFGDGLGNQLFPWARATVAARRRGWTEIWPTWRQVFHRGGASDVLREIAGRFGQRGLRNYNDFFVQTGDQVTGPRKLSLLWGRRQLNEADADAARAGEVVVFEGMGRRFADFPAEHAFLAAELWRRARPRFTAEALAHGFAGSITLHVRLGDFWGGRSYQELREVRHSSRIPLEWYAEKVRQLRGVLGATAPVHLFSDGTDAELAELLALPGCRRLTFGNALGDLRAMGQANVLVASLSTMAAWAAFLGRPHLVHLRGARPVAVYAGGADPEREIESDFGEELPDEFLRMVRTERTGSLA